MVRSILKMRTQGAIIALGSEHFEVRSTCTTLDFDESNADYLLAVAFIFAANLIALAARAARFEPLPPRARVCSKSSHRVEPIALPEPAEEALELALT